MTHNVLQVRQTVEEHLNAHAVHHDVNFTNAGVTCSMLVRSCILQAIVTYIKLSRAFNKS